jgi:RNA polymerase sigma-70 factor (ECF subfamily)
VDSAECPDELHLNRIAAGDPDAFSRFYREHLDAVVAFFGQRVTSPELAFDLAAETFAAVIGSAGSYAGDGPAVAWLFGIARNKLRESARRGRVEAAARSRLGLAPIALDDTDLARVEQRVQAGQLDLAGKLAALPESMREALIARVVDERSYAQIARELRCSEQVVRQRVSRGLERLRTAIEEDS